MRRRGRPPRTSGTDRLLLVLLAVALLLMGWQVLAPTVTPGAPESAATLTGEPRDVNVELLRRRILSGQLSDHEALYYHRER